MPESKARKKDSGSSEAGARKKGNPKTAAEAKKTDEPKKKVKFQTAWYGRLVAPVMLTLWGLGIAWIVVYYIASDKIGFMAKLGNWNLLIGMGLIALGFVVSTQWE